MKKQKFLVALLLAAALFLTGCGNVSSVRREITLSPTYNASEISDAMDEVVSHFKKKFDGCKLIELSYSEERTISAGAAWAEQYGDEEGIVLLSEFTVDESGGDGSLKPNGTYTGWQWILTRSDGGDWVLRTWGYG